MNRRFSRFHGRSGHLGITVPEVLLVVAVILVLLSFAAPSLTGATARAELKDATAGMDLGIRMARSTARRLDTVVIMHLQNDRKARLHSVTFSMPELPLDAAEAAMLVDYHLPESVRLETNGHDVRFDGRGIVAEPVQIALVSLHDDDLYERLLIN